LVQDKKSEKSCSSFASSVKYPTARELEQQMISLLKSNKRSRNL
jgi:hypothetical protein